MTGGVVIFVYLLSKLFLDIKIKKHEALGLVLSILGFVIGKTEWLKSKWGYQL